MAVKTFISCLILTLMLIGCSKEYDCADLQLQPAFIGFSTSEIDTLILRKFKANDNYQHLVDSFIVKDGYSGRYETSNDTTIVTVTDGKNGIKVDYDWQISIPSIGKTVLVSSIVSENKTVRCGSGLFSMDKFGCVCTNEIYSAEINNQVISFSNSTTGRHLIFIRR